MMVKPFSCDCLPHMCVCDDLYHQKYSSSRFSIYSKWIVSQIYIPNCHGQIIFNVRHILYSLLLSNRKELIRSSCCIYPCTLTPSNTVQTEFKRKRKKNWNKTWKHNKQRPTNANGDCAHRTNRQTNVWREKMCHWRARCKMVATNVSCWSLVALNWNGRWSLSLTVNYHFSCHAIYLLYQHIDAQYAQQS